MHDAPALGNSQSCRANLMKTQEIHCLAPFLSRTVHGPSSSKVVGCFSTSLLQDGCLAPKQEKE